MNMDDSLRSLDEQAKNELPDEEEPETRMSGSEALSATADIFDAIEGLARTMGLSPEEAVDNPLVILLNRNLLNWMPNVVADAMLTCAMLRWYERDGGE